MLGHAPHEPADTQLFILTRGCKLDSKDVLLSFAKHYHFNGVLRLIVPKSSHVILYVGNFLATDANDSVVGLHAR